MIRPTIGRTASMFTSPAANVITSGIRAVFSSNTPLNPDGLNFSQVPETVCEPGYVAATTMGRMVCTLKYAGKILLWRAPKFGRVRARKATGEATKVYCRSNY